jgi:hypothetical protein
VGTMTSHRHPAKAHYLRHDSAFPRKRLVKFRTRRFRGNVADVAAAPCREGDAVSAAGADVVGQLAMDKSG